MSDTFSEFRVYTKDIPIANVVKLDNFWAKSRGVIGRDAPAIGNGYWLTRTGSIHTYFVSYPLDIIFTDLHLKIIAIHQSVKPWKPYLGSRHGENTFELSNNTLNTITAVLSIGDQLHIEQF